MGFTAIGSGSTTYNLVDDPGTNTQHYLLREGLYRYANADVIQGSGLSDNMRLMLHGELFGRGDAVSVNTTGSARADIGPIAILNSADEAALRFNLIATSTAEISNSGNMNGHTSGIYTSLADEFFLNNTGEISASMDVGTGVELYLVDEAEIFNSGIISGSTAVFHNEDRTTFVMQNEGTLQGASYGLRMGAVNSNELINSGTIMGNTAIWVEGYNVSDSASRATEITNTGTIAGRGIDAISFNSQRPGQGWQNRLDLTNSGEIFGRVQVYQGGVQEDEIYNSGTIRGSVALNRGDDRIENSGLIHGIVDTGGENDTVSNSDDIHGSILTGFGNDEVRNTGNILYAVSTSSGNDTVVNQGQIGIVNLGTGDDVYDGREGILTNTHAPVVDYDIAGGEGNDRIIISDGSTVFYEAEDQGTDTVESSASYELGSNVEVLRLLGADNLSGTGNGENNAITGNAGNNRLTGVWGDDSVYGGAGSDTVLGDQGNDFLSGGEGWDTVRGGSGDDTLLGGEGRDRLDGGSGVDRASYFDAEHEGVRADLRNASNNTGIAEGDSYTSIENLYGSRLDDRLDGDDNNNQLIGHRGDDTIWGWDGDDNIDGMWDDDRIYGNRGDDTMRGGSGSDTFYFYANNGNDVITDYQDGTDSFRFFIGGLTYGGLSISNSGGNAIIDYGTGQITLNGVNSAVLDASDFVF